MRTILRLGRVVTSLSGAAPRRLVQPATITQTSGDHFGSSKPSAAVWFSSSAAQEVHVHVSADVTLFQDEMCPLCHKVRAFLDYNKIPYNVKEANWMTKNLIKWCYNEKLPILKIDEQIADSSDIIDKLSQMINPGFNAEDSEEEKRWRHWVDNHLVHVVSRLSPKIYPNLHLEGIAELGSNTSHVSAEDSAVVSKRIEMLMKRRNITDAALDGAAETWVDALKGRQFHGGLTPNLADLAVFGVLMPIGIMVGKTHIGEW